jgi:hypothetical protein
MDHLHLGPGYMKKLADFEYQRYFLLLPPGVTFEHLFNPIFWAHHKQLRQWDLIRVRAEDGAFDCTITVAGLTQGGAIMEMWPKYPIGADGEIGDNVATQAAINETIRPAAIKKAIGDSKARVEYTKRTGWRVIGVDGNEVSREHPNKAAAELELAKHLAVLGLSTEAA